MTSLFLGPTYSETAGNAKLKMPQWGQSVANTLIAPSLVECDKQIEEILVPHTPSAADFLSPCQLRSYLVKIRADGVAPSERLVRDLSTMSAELRALGDVFPDPEAVVRSLRMSGRLISNPWAFSALEAV